MQKTPRLFFLAVALLLWAGLARAADVHPASALDELVAVALANNPELHADEARWESFRHKARQAGVLEDPMLMLRAQNLLIRDPVAFDRDSTSAKVIGLSQTLPFFGKRALNREAADQEAEAARWSLAERRLELSAMVKEAWYQLLFVDQALAITEKNITLLDDLGRFRESMYSVGQGSQQEVARTHLERSRMEEMRIALRQQRRSLEATLNTLAFRPADTPITPTAALVITPLAMTAAELEALAEESRPLLRGLAAREEKSRLMRELAAKERFPDFTLAVEYMQREPSTMDSDGFDMYSAGVIINLPIQQQRRQAMVAESEAEQRMVRGEGQAARNRIRLAIADGLARLERSSHLAQLYREGLIPQAEHVHAAATATYRAGKGSFMEVLESRMTLFTLEREYFDAVAEHQMQLARLEAAIGTPLPVAKQ